MLLFCVALQSLLLESQLLEAQMERERPLVLCVVVLCCYAESSVGVSVNGGADGAGETAEDSEGGSGQTGGCGEGQETVGR